MHEETHSVTRISWLRAAILGANDGIVSTASLIAGVAAAGASRSYRYSSPPSGNSSVRASGAHWYSTMPR